MSTTLLQQQIDFFLLNYITMALATGAAISTNTTTDKLDTFGDNGAIPSDTTSASQRRQPWPLPSRPFFHLSKFHNLVGLIILFLVHHPHNDNSNHGGIANNTMQ